MTHFYVLIGSDVDPHCRIHDGFRSHVRQDLEGACHLQKCEDEEKGIEMFFWVFFGFIWNLFIYLRQ